MYDAKYSADYLKRFGFNELVAAYGTVNFEVEDLAVRVDVAVPFTFPPLGISRFWQSYEKIHEIPDLHEVMDNERDCSLNRLVISNINRLKMYELKRGFYEQIGALDSYEEDLDSAAARFGGDVNLMLNSFDGMTFQVRLDDTGRTRNIQLKRHLDRKTAIRAMDVLHKIENKRTKIKREPMEMFGHPSWFYSDANAKKQSRINGVSEEELNSGFGVRNIGDVVTNRWSVRGEKSNLQKILQNGDIESVELAKGIRKYSKQFVPFVRSRDLCEIEIRQGGVRNAILVTDMRYAYYKTFMNDRYARRSGLFYPVSKSIPVKTRTDRYFSVMEMLYRGFLNEVDSDISGFFMKKDRMIWSYEWRPMQSED